MIQKTLRVKNRVVVLPKNLQKSWGNSEVLARITPTTVVLRKVMPSSFWDTWEKMKSAKPKVSKKTIERAITWARNS